MITKSSCITLIFLLSFAILRAQDQAPSLFHADLSLGFKSNAQTLAIGINRLHPIALKQKFSIGYGIRFTGFSGQNNNFITAPAKISEGNFFKRQNPDKLDTLTMNGGVISVNAAIYLNYKINEKWSVQFNIDAIGFSFGSEQTGSFVANSQGIMVQSVNAKPTRLNLLLTGDYDFGSLNSELIGTYNFHKSAIKFGLTFMFNEYTTSQKLTFNNDRFRVKNLIPLLGYKFNF